MTLTDIKTKCPGLYCGIYVDMINGTKSWSDCGACPRGYRVDIMSDVSECVRCVNSPSRYDWEYLGFMAMLPLILHWFFIDLAAKERWFVQFFSFPHVPVIHSVNFIYFSRFSFTKGEIVLHLSAFFEVLISAVITLLIYEPYWSLEINSCSVSRLSDWYTLFHNPTPNYEKKLYCTQEAVYPLLVTIHILWNINDLCDSFLIYI